jgi:hypothetical protein
VIRESESYLDFAKFQPDQNSNPDEVLKFLMRDKRGAALGIFHHKFEGEEGSTRSNDDPDEHEITLMLGPANVIDVAMEEWRLINENKPDPWPRCGLSGLKRMGKSEENSGNANGVAPKEAFVKGIPKSLKESEDRLMEIVDYATT